MRVAIGLLCLGLIGCSSKPSDESKVGTIGFVSVFETPEKLKFRRTYSRTLSTGHTVVIDIEDCDWSWCRNGREVPSVGKLMQADGKYVHFILNNLPEKIVYESLIAPVEEAIEDILAADALYVKEREVVSRSFVDAKGVQWVSK